MVYPPRPAVPCPARQEARRGPVVAATILLVALLTAACAPLPRTGGSTVLWHPSPNEDARRPNFVVIHDTGSDDARRALTTLTDPERQVSAHYLIARDGTVLQLVDESRRAWHAGVSAWGPLSDLNSASLGIELDNNGSEPYPPEQITALKALLGEIVPRHRIPPGNIVGHGDVAPGRKVDPSRLFPWKELAAAGFGQWCEPDPEAPLPPLDGPLALRALGYETSNLTAAIAAFRRHHLGDDGETLGEDGLRRLACLLRAAPPL